MTPPKRSAAHERLLLWVTTASKIAGFDNLDNALRAPGEGFTGPVYYQGQLNGYAYALGFGKFDQDTLANLARAINRTLRVLTLTKAEYTSGWTGCATLTQLDQVGDLLRKEHADAARREAVLHG